jgi:hypothetical protein
MVAAACTSSRRAGAPWLGVDRLYWVALIVFAGRCLMVAWFGHFPNAYDEHAHFSYALHVLQTGDIAPSLDELRLTDPTSPARWSDERNYLNHPSPYYVLLAWAARPFDLSAAGLIRAWRLLGVALATLGVALILRLAREAGWSAPAQAAFVAMIALNPTLPVLGGIVSNDNLAIVGGALTCLGVFRLLAGARSGGVWVTVAAGVLTASLAKLTAALLCGLLLAFALARLIAGAGLAALRSWQAWLCLSAAALGAMPYLALIIEHGSPAPYTAGQAAILASRLAEMPEWQTSRLGFWPFVAHFWQSLLVYWPPVTPASSAQIVLLALPASCLGLSLIAALGALRAVAAGRGDDPTACLVACGVLAMAVMLMVHLGFTFARHQDTGWLRGVYPRYYFPLLAVLPAACAWLIERCQDETHRRALGGVVIAATVGYDVLHRVLGAD